MPSNLDFFNEGIERFLHILVCCCVCCCVPQSYPVIYMVDNPVRDLLGRKISEEHRGSFNESIKANQNKNETKAIQRKEQQHKAHARKI